MEELVSIRQAGIMIGRTGLTIKHWYKWVEQVGGNNLPVTLPKRHRRGSRGDYYFDSKDIDQLAKFRDFLALNPGIMKEYNWTRQGEKGRIRADRFEFKNVIKNL